MTTLQENRALIITELTSDDSEVRSLYLKEFGADVDAFADAMAQAVVDWNAIDALTNGDEKKGYVTAIAFAALTLHTTSMKLFLSGHIIAAGNMTRQVVECLTMSVLCSAKELDVLARFMEDRYSTNDAVRDVLRQADRLNLKADGLAALRSSQEFYHRYNLSRMTLAATISFSDEGAYVGASFDPGKIEAYRKEVTGRVSLAKALPNVFQGVKAQLSAW